MAACRKRTFEEIVNSDTDPDESDFEGFSSESDISIASDSSEYGSDSEQEDPEPQRDEWTTGFSPITVHDFTGNSGPNLPDDFDVTTANPLDYFWLLFNAQLFTEMAHNTNSYARWRMDQNNAQDPYWSDTTSSELRAFIGLEILMGINQLPDSAMYWSKNTFIGNAGIQEVMTANRYQKLKQYFHVSDRQAEPARGHPEYDRLYKVRPILNHVSASFLERYDVGREVAIDEAMVRYTGKLSFRQYMPAKPIKRGIKVWMACDSNSSYLSRFEVYLGRRAEGTEHGLGYNVVTSLTDNLQGSYRHVFFDNFFTGIPPLEHLLDRGLYGCGTVRVNRQGFPPELKKPRDVKNRGEFQVMQKGNTNLTASVWKDKRLVYHLSTLNQPDDIRPAQRRVGPNMIQLRQPATVHSYNNHMGGVDQHDQLRMNYSVGRNSKKWWRYLFWFFVNCAIVNSFILFKETSQRPKKKKRFTHLDFRIELAQALIAGFSSRKRNASENENVGFMEAQNLNGHINCKLSKPKGRCRYHLKQGIRKETVYGCSICKVHLCRDGCHARFHN